MTAQGGHEMAELSHCEYRWLSVVCKSVGFLQLELSIWQNVLLMVHWLYRNVLFDLKCVLLITIQNNFRCWWLHLNKSWYFCHLSTSSSFSVPNWTCNSLFGVCPKTFFLVKIFLIWYSYVLFSNSIFVQRLNTARLQITSHVMSARQF